MVNLKKDELPDVLIFVTRKTLTDGSEAFNVKLGEHEWPAVTEDDAGEMAEKIREAIEDHSNSTCDVIYE